MAHFRFLGIILFCILFSLLGCATSPNQRVDAPTKEQLSALHDKKIQESWVCITKNIALMDDGRSDAETVTRAVSGACDRELSDEATVAIYSISDGKMHDKDYYFLMDQVKKMNRDRILRAVLKSRVGGVYSR